MHASVVGIPVSWWESAPSQTSTLLGNSLAFWLSTSPHWHSPGNLGQDQSPAEPDKLCLACGSTVGKHQSLQAVREAFCLKLELHRAPVPPTDPRGVSQPALLSAHLQGHEVITAAAVVFTCTCAR